MAFLLILIFTYPARLDLIDPPGVCVLAEEKAKRSALGNEPAPCWPQCCALLLRLSTPGF